MEQHPPALDFLACGPRCEEVLRENERLAALVEIGRDLTATLDRREVLSRIVSHARRLLSARTAYLLVERNGSLQREASDGEGLPADALEVDASIVRRVLQDGAPLAIDEIRADDAFPQAGHPRNESLGGVIAVPLSSQSRRLGVLTVYIGEPRSLRAEDLAFMVLVGQQAAVALQNATLFEEVRQAGEHLRASEKLAALGRLSSGLAHELRNPLNTLNVLSYAMLEHSRRSGGSTSDLEVMQTEIRRMGLLLEQFLDFARPRSPRFQRQQVEEVLEETMLLVGPEAANRRIEVRRRFGPRTPRVWADGDQLKQAFLNLFLNALQAVDRDGSVEVGVRSGAGGVVVEMRDDGRGISPEDLDRLFEPFFTTRERGTGLGLPIALRIIESHSGDLSVHSELGVGTTATVWLPL